MNTLTSDPLFILLIGIIIVVGGIIGLRLHAFLALLLAAFVVAILTPVSSIEIFALSKGMSAKAALQMANWHVGKRIATEFGNTCGKIGILIAMASIIGKCMLESGAAEKIVRSLIKWTGVKNAPLSFLGGSFFLGIPVFFDTVFYLMVPLAKALAFKLGKNYLLLILCITAGAAMANSLVPPTPGPLFLISEMNIPIGMMMVGGFSVGLVTISTGYMYAVWANKRWPVPLRDSIDAPLKNIEELSLQSDAHLPSLWSSLLPILIPIVFITLKAGMDTYFDPTSTENLFVVIINFVGEKNTALISGALASLILLVLQKSEDNSAMVSAVQTALMSGGVIILITAAGGAFGGMLQQTGISARIGELTQGYQMAIIPLAFLISAVVRTAQGSATVAMITASGILSGMAATMDLGYHPLYIGLAIACGSKLIPWMNDSGFWIVCKMSNLTEKEALKTFSPTLTIMGLTGLIVVFIAAKIWPLI
ncbi:MAG: GntP family permease [Cyclobacteriaceae bacterium]|jgi:gluconate:H+ symporter, GntP family|nr:GntP family permease [Cyclobacteriaceae bacterium]